MSKDKIPVRYKFNGKEEIGFLSPVTGKAETWWLHDKKNSYMVGTLTNIGRWEFKGVDGKNHLELAELLSKAIIENKKS